MVPLPGSTDSVTVAEYGMRNSDRPAGLVESPVLSNGHAGFGRRDEETDQSKDRHRASSRPHYQWVYAQPVADLGLRHRDGAARHDHRDRAAGVLRPSSSPTWTPPPSGASTNSTPSTSCSPPDPGCHPPFTPGE